MNAVAISARAPVGASVPDRVLAWVPGVAVILLYTVLASIGRYHVTVGGLFCIVALLWSGRALKLPPTVTLVAIFLLVAPALIVLGCWLVDAELTPEITRFLQSYALWAVSVALIVVGFATRRPLLVRHAFWINVVVVAVAAAQSIGARVFGTYWAYELVQPLLRFDLFDSYLNLADMENARAIGFYYEPSMCARVIGTLCFIDVLMTNRIWRNIALLALGVIFTLSVGLVVLSAALGLILLGRSMRELLGLLVGAALIATVAAPVLSARVVAPGASTDSSAYRRTLAPLETVGFALAHYPVGLPSGSAEALAHTTGYDAETNEPEITNGLYEFLTYFGVVGPLLVILALFAVSTLLLRRERELAAGLLYLLISTALSGSYLSIESSLLIYFLLTAAALGRARRLSDEATRAKAGPRRLTRPGSVIVT